MIFIGLITLGITIGIISALFGVGGGFLTVPLLVSLFPEAPFQSAVGVGLFLKKRTVHWIIPAFSLLLLSLFSFGIQKPVLIDRLLFKFSAQDLFSRVEYFSDVGKYIQESSVGLATSTRDSVYIPGTHTLFGDVLLRVGFPHALIYILILIFLLFRAWRHIRSFIGSKAIDGLLLILVIPLVQNIVNANMLQPFSFLNTVFAVLAICILSV